jgi:hypothetical protein
MREGKVRELFLKRKISRISEFEIERKDDLAHD